MSHSNNLCPPDQCFPRCLHLGQFFGATTAPRNFSFYRWSLISGCCKTIQLLPRPRGLIRRNAGLQYHKLGCLSFLSFRPSLVRETWLSDCFLQTRVGLFIRGRKIQGLGLPQCIIIVCLQHKGTITKIIFFQKCL